MKICFLVEGYPTLPRYGGIATYVRTAAQALAARGHEVHVLVMQYQPETPSEAMDGPVHLHFRRFQWLPLIGRWFPAIGETLWAAWAFAALHRTIGFDVIEYPNWQGIGLALGWLRLLPTVARLHTSMTETLDVAGKSPTLGDRVMIWAERVSAQWACRVVTHSQSHRAKLMASYQLSQVEMIPHGIGLPPWNGTQTGPQTGRLGVLSVGPLTARKGIQTLLRAIKPVVEAVPEVEFWIAGGGADHAKVVKRFGEEYPELAGHVRFLGFVADEELARLYEQCALYVSAAIYESFGLTFVEAMARGKATVGCLAGAVPEIVVHEATGLLVPPSDSEAMAAAIVRLLRHPEERTTMGVRGRERAETRFSDAVMAEGIEKLFESVRAEFSF